MQDRLFFFGGVQATINNQQPVSRNQFVPTAEMLQGDFRRVMSAACRGGTARTLGAPFVNNQVDPALFNPTITEGRAHDGAASGSRARS